MVIANGSKKRMPPRSVVLRKPNIGFICSLVLRLVSIIHRTMDGFGPPRPGDRQGLTM